MFKIGPISEVFLKGRGNLADLGTAGTIILKLFLKKLGVPK
jgi:hypothetical protein